MRATNWFLTSMALVVFAGCGKQGSAAPAASESSSPAAATSPSEHAAHEHAAEAEAAASAGDVATTDDAKPVEDAVASPAGGTASAKELPGLRDKLQARHVEDLPSYDDLLAMDGAESGLRWLAENDETLVVRARALDLLGYFDHAGTVAYLRGVLADGGAHDKLKAASVIGLGRTDLSKHDDARADLLALAGGTDLRLALEAVSALSDVPEARASLDGLAKSAETLEAVRDALTP